MSRLQNLDRRLLYLLLVLVVGVPTLVDMRIPIAEFPDSAELFRTVEGLPREKPVILLANWGGGTAAESRPQGRALMEHLMRRGIPFIIFGWDPQGFRMMQDDALAMAPRYGRVYGRDWVNFGYRLLDSISTNAIIRNIPGFMRQDMDNTPVARLPLMRRVRTLGDCSLVVDISALVGTTNTWVGLGLGAFPQVKMAAAVTAVAAPEAYPLMASGQLRGFLAGMRGAAEYEALLDSPGPATQRMPAQSGAHLLIITLIILGNWAYLASRRASSGRGTP